MLIRYWPAETNIPFMKFNTAGVALSILMIVGSIFLLATRGLNLGVDFAGGSLIELAETDTVTVSEVRSRIPGGLTVNSATGSDNKRLVVVRFGELDESLLGPEFEALSEDEKAARASSLSNSFVVSELKREFGLSDNDILRNDSVGAKVSEELFWESLLALGVATLFMLLYIAFRYSWSYAVGGIAALLHDTIGTLGLFSLLQIEFDLTTVAALLTIIGYSMNDSVVVFDRMREVRRKYKQMSGSDVINLATNQTLSRTFLTAGAVFIAVLAMLFFGGPVLKGMSVAMLWGIFIGTYSSIFFASAIVLALGTEVNKPSDEIDVTGFRGVP
jgi:preprotein translocase subunit SecF/SecD/SecF fusion protein